jgi:hypothetical protein
MKTCHFLSFLASLWIERPQRMPVWLRRHMDRCDSCRRTFQAELEIVRRLPVVSLSANPSIPTRLKQRILAHARTPEPPSAWAPPGLGRWIASGAAIAVCVGALVLLMPRPDQEPEHWAEAGQVDAGTAAAFTWSTSPLDRITGEELLRWGKVMHEPLEQEWARAVEDGHRLLAAVVESCVPDPAADALLSRTRQLLPGREAHSLPE